MDYRVYLVISMPVNGLPGVVNGQQAACRG